MFKKIKKSIAVFAALLLVSSSLSASMALIGCASYAIGAATMEEAYYGAMSDQEFIAASDFYYDACMASNGQIQDPNFM